VKYENVELASCKRQILMLEQEKKVMKNVFFIIEKQESQPIMIKWRDFQPTVKFF
jgi:hypothetical protein